ncbi:MAG: ABC transporter permease, partial [Deltaproteobacteria bacterium]|nr:ABC transporter permease [Deltaproteobacteria bacterium]
MGVERHIALRYLRAKRRNNLLSLISVLAVGGVGLGVAALIVVLAVLAGFETSLKEKLLGLQPHVTVFRPSSNISDWRMVAEKIKGVPGVVSVQPAVSGQVMVASRVGAAGVVMVGVDPELAGESDFFGPMNLSPNGLENLTRHPMLSPYPPPENYEFGSDEFDFPDGDRPIPGIVPREGTDSSAATDDDPGTRVTAENIGSPDERGSDVSLLFTASGPASAGATDAPSDSLSGSPSGSSPGASPGEDPVRESTASESA